MLRIISDYLECAESASNEDQLRDAVAAVINLFDFSAFAFLALSHEGSPPLLISNYDERWQHHYIVCGYQRRDPVMLHSRHDNNLFMWGSEMAERFGPLARDFFHEAKTFNICSGATVPVPEWPGGFAAMTFVTDSRQEQLANCLRCHGSALLFVAANFQNHLRRMREPTRLIENAELSPREYECLRWAAVGKSQTDIAMITGISLRSVARDIENLRAKLGVRSIAQAVAIFAAYEATGNKRAY